MISTRRAFLASAAAATSAAAAPTTQKAFFGLHPFIDANPKAVFIRRTQVPHKMDAARKLAEGLQLGREIFVPMAQAGIPITHKILLKPNITSVRSRRPAEENWGTGTDPDFYEGLILSLKELGIKSLHSAEANMYYAWHYRGFMDIHERHGVRMNEPEQRMNTGRMNPEVNWSTVPGAVVYKRIPHYAPVGDSDSWLLNIAKWKGHSMVLTQAVKNVQGLVTHPYVRFCPGWAMVTGCPDHMKENIAPDVERRVQAYFDNHKRIGYARYDVPPEQKVSPIQQEIWAHKTCDHHSVLKTGLAMIEGIYGRDGDGFDIGTDYLTNLVMFSRDSFRLDLVGLWLGGHEPGNVNLYRIAKERGLSNTFNPWDVPVYEWIDGRAEPRKLTDFPRTELKSIYLQKDGEPNLHLVNEPFDYDKIRS